MWSYEVRGESEGCQVSGKGRGIMRYIKIWAISGRRIRGERERGA